MKTFKRPCVSQGWRDGLVTKNICCFRRGHEFGSQDPCVSLQSSFLLGSGDLTFLVTPSLNCQTIETRKPTPPLPPKMRISSGISCWFILGEGKGSSQRDLVHLPPKFQTVLTIILYGVWDHTPPLRRLATLSPAHYLHFDLTSTSWRRTPKGFAGSLCGSSECGHIE